MKKLSLIEILALFVFSVFFSSSYADNLGRIFTTPEQRQKLERIRLMDDEPIKVVVDEVKEIEEPQPEVRKEIIIRDKISLKGLVHRSDGKSTAWINDFNTFEGDVDSQFFKVPDRNIKANNVTVVLPEDKTEVELRVGEEFVPEPIEKEVLHTE